MLKLDIQYFSSDIPYPFTITKIVENNQVTVKLTPDDTDVGYLGVDVNGNSVYIDDNCDFSLEGWTKVNDGNGSLSKVYTSNTTENVSVEYTTINANIVTFEGTVVVTEIGTESSTPEEPPISSSSKYEPVGWEAGTMITPAMANLTTGEITPAVISGGTPIIPENLNHMDNAILDLYNGGATTNEIVISDTQPTTEDWKIWIDSDEVENIGSEVVRTLEGNETDKAPCVQAVNGAIDPFKSLGILNPIYTPVVYQINSIDKTKFGIYSVNNATDGPITGHGNDNYIVVNLPCVHGADHSIQIAFSIWVGNSGMGGTKIYWKKGSQTTWQSVG